MAAYNYMINNFNNGEDIIASINFLRAPPGSGLGSSSTIVVSIVKALADYLSVALDDYEIARIAFIVEREIANCKEVSKTSMPQHSEDLTTWNLKKTVMF